MNNVKSYNENTHSICAYMSLSNVLMIKKISLESFTDRNNLI